MENSLSIFARALATENLSFSFDATAETASFDVKNRHLVMPVWDVSETVQTMLVAHEISHALWTPYDRSEELLAEAEMQGYNKVVLQRIANVIEDVRIEKLMKEKYPGTRRDFFLGYKEIMDRDMFHLRTIDLNRASLISRLNIHYKFGLPGFIDIALNDDEVKIAGAIDRIKDFDQVMAVAKILYDHPAMKDEVEKAVSKLQSDGNAEGDDPTSGVPGDLMSGIGKKNGDEYCHGVVTIDPISNLDNQIITSECLLRHHDRYVAMNPGYRTAPNIEEYRKFVRESDAFVRQLVAQFERKKAADEIRKERPKQTGMLNLDRLHQYRTHDDIFLSKIVKQEGKNHGIVFLIDCSGSMATTLGDCFLQVLQLVWFCEKAKIPFEVFGFTDCTHPDYREQYEEARRKYMAQNDFSDEGFSFHRDPIVEKPCPTSLMYHDVKLIQFATSKDKPEDRERLLSYLYDTYVKSNRPPVTAMSGTPTVEAVALASQFILKWINVNKIQIPTLMVVTDGAPNGISIMSNAHNKLAYRQIENCDLTVHNRITNTMHRFDNKEYAGLDLSNAMICTMLDALREKVGLRSVGMFVGPKSFNENIYSAYCISRKEQKEFYARPVSVNLSLSPRYAKAKEQYMDGAIVLPDSTFPGYDGFFLVKTPKIVNDEDAIADGGTYTRIKNVFVRTMGKRTSSRVFLTRYVDIVAGQPVKGMGEDMYRLPYLNAA